MNIYDPEGAPGRRRGRGDEADHPRTHRPAGAVPPATRGGAARPRPAVLDRGSRLRHRLPRPPPRRAGARHARAARRGRQPHPRPPARSQPPAVGALRHRGRRRRHEDRPAHQGPPRHDRRRVGRADAGRHPRHRARRPAARASRRRGRPTASRPTPSCSSARCWSTSATRRSSSGCRSGRSASSARSTGSGGLQAMADVIAQPMPGPFGDLLRDRLRNGAQRGRRPAGAAADAGAPHAVERDRSRPTAASPTRRSRSTTPRRSAGPSAARSTTS